MKRPLQPYEAHVQYIPQWMCDYNLYGCAIMSCSQAKFRAPVPEYFELSNLAHRWHDRSILPESILDHPALQKQSHCALEVDVCVQDILNRLDVKERPLHHDFTELLKPVAVNERLVPSVAGLWQDETRRRKKRMGLTDPGSTPFGPEELVSMSADPRDQSKGGWIHEEEFREMASQLAANEKQADGGKDTSFGTFLDTDDQAKYVKTALDSTEDFFPGKISTSTFDSSRSQEPAEQKLSEISVDEGLALSSQTDGQYYSDSDQGGHSLEGIIEHEPETKQDPLGDSFYDEIFDEMPFLDVAAPAESAETNCPEAAMDGGYKEGDYVAQERRPRDQSQNKSVAPKRQRSETLDCHHSPTKRARHIAEHGLSDGPLESPNTRKHQQDDKPKNVSFDSNLDSHAETPSSESKSSSQRTVRPKAHSYTSGLKFPVVKDPNDPLTILRYSQDEATSSRKDPRVIPAPLEFFPFRICHGTVRQN